MAKKIGLLFVVCVCILVPVGARADDGGFWDMIWNWDTKFSGCGTDFHWCFDSSGRFVKCEEWFTKIWHNPFSTEPLEHRFSPTQFRQLKHELDFRVSLMHSYGRRIASENLSAADTSNTTLTARNSDKLWASRLMGFYYYRINRVVDIGAGVGFLPVWGLENGAVWRPIQTISLVTGIGGAWYLRFEENHFGGTISAQDLLGSNGTTVTTTHSIGPEWRPSIALGIDFRRLSN
jgi:hypothetical protein